MNTAETAFEKHCKRHGIRLGGQYAEEIKVHFDAGYAAAAKEKKLRDQAKGE